MCLKWLILQCGPSITKCCTAIHFKYGRWWDFIKQRDYDYACYLGGGLDMTMLFLGGGLMHMLTARALIRLSSGLYRMY